VAGSAGGFGGSAGLGRLGVLIDRVVFPVVSQARHLIHSGG
jgi:hypothetical protein